MLKKILNKLDNPILIKPKTVGCFGGYVLTNKLSEFYNRDFNYLQAVTILNKLLLALKEAIKKDDSVIPKAVSQSLVADINSLVTSFLDNRDMKDFSPLSEIHNKLFLNLITSYYTLNNWFEETNKLTKAAEVWGKHSVKSPTINTLDN